VGLLLIYLSRPSLFFKFSRLSPLFLLPTFGSEVYPERQSGSYVASLVETLHETKDDL